MLISTKAFGALAFDAAASNFAGPPSSSLSWSHTCTGSNLVLTVAVNAENSLTSGVTYNGTSMLSVGTTQYGSSTRAEISFWKLANPSTGANTVAVTLSGASLGVQGGSISMTGADQGTSIEAIACSTGTSTTPATSVTTITDNAWIIDCTGQQVGGLTLTVGGSQTQRWNRAEVTGGSAGSTLGPITPPASTSMTWTLSGSADWGICAISVKPVVASSTYDPLLLLMTGSD